MKKGLTKKETDWGLNELKKLDLVSCSKEKKYKIKEDAKGKFFNALEYFYREEIKAGKTEKIFESALNHAIVLLVGSETPRTAQQYSILTALMKALLKLYDEGTLKKLGGYLEVEEAVKNFREAGPVEIEGAKQQMSKAFEEHKETIDYIKEQLDEEDYQEEDKMSEGDINWGLKYLEKWGLITLSKEGYSITERTGNLFFGLIEGLLKKKEFKKDLEKGNIDRIFDSALVQIVMSGRPMQESEIGTLVSILRNLMRLDQKEVREGLRESMKEFEQSIR